MKLHWLAWLIILCGCSVSPVTAPSRFYDFGPRPENPLPSLKIESLLLIETVQAPSWLETNAIVYRLSGESAKRQSYANSYWVGAPGDLITARLAGKLADASNKGIVRAGQGIPADYSLRVELIEFAQVFDSPQASRGVVQLRASLIDRNPRALIAQKTFTVVKPAPSLDAAGAVNALSSASDTAIAEIVEWIARTLEGSAKGAGPE